MSDFDPYYKWLGIPRSEQPPNLYRLLGLATFESDLAVIDTAANGRMMLLRSLQLTEHGDLQQKLSNEVSAARVRLLNPQQKSTYDADLRVRIARARAAQSGATGSSATSGAPQSPVVLAPGAQPSAGKPLVAKLVAPPPSQASALPSPLAAQGDGITGSQSEASDFFSELGDLGSAASDKTALRGKQTAAAGGRHRHHHGKQQSQRPLWLIAAAIAVLAAALLVAFALSNNNSSSAPPVPAAGAGLPAHLVFDWPEDERVAVRLQIDDKPQEIPPSGAVEFALPPGEHKLVLRRLGNATIEATLVLRQDERRQFKPDWKLAEPGQSTVAARIAASNDMRVSDALPELRHWSTDLADAQHEATRERKDVFIAFFGPDNRQWCLQLASELLLRDEFRKFVDSRFELVLLEEPAAAPSDSGKGALEGGTVAAAAHRYGVTSFPTIVLTDADGLAYYREEYKQVSVIDHLQSLSAALATRRERDKLFAPTETGSAVDRLAAAQKALDWLEKNDLAPFYTSKIHAWLGSAKKIDPDNKQGLYESFFLAEIHEQLKVAGKGDAEKIQTAAEPLQAWQKQGRKFKDGDLAARAFLTVAGLLFNAGDPHAALSYIEGAYNCNPSDPRLKDYLGQLHELMLSPVSFGSGFVFAPGGYVLTNNHVIAGDGNIFVRVPGDKKEIPADVVTSSAQLDLAVVKLRGDVPPTVRPLQLATATLPRGSEVVAFGYPLGGEDIKLTQGPISAPPTDRERLYVLDMRVNPGNSGGPLVDMKGEVVGIVSAKTISRDEKEDSYGLAIPGQAIASFLQKAPKPIPGFHSLTADESAGLPELDKLTKVDAMVSQAVVQIVKRRD